MNIGIMVINFIKWFSEILTNVIIKKTKGFSQICETRTYFTKSNGNDIFPSDSHYKGEHPIIFFTENSIVNAHVFINNKQTYIIKNINKIKFIWFILINQILLKVGKIKLFKLSAIHKNELTLCNSKDFKNISLSSTFETTKIINPDIEYYPEKKLIDKFLKHNFVEKAS